MRLTFLTALTLFASLVWASDEVQLEQRWLTEGLRTPESVLYYPDADEPFLLVSEIEGEGSAVDGQGGIAKLSLEGEIFDEDWVRGLNAPKGMAYYDDKLYVADIKEVVVISLSKGEVLYKVPVPDSVFLNDVTVDSQGEVFVSDTRTNKVHRIVGKKVETYLEDVSAANGLSAIDGQLIVGAGNALLSFDAGKEKTVLAKGFESQIDGVEQVGANEFLVSCWVGLLYYVQADGTLELLIDSREQEINTADIGYNAQDRTVYVPNFFADSVTAYRVR